MEILRGTLWSRIREQNSVYKEFLEIVGNEKPTGNVWKETIAVSATIWISVGKVHHQIRLRILSCGRVSENHRGPEVPEVRARVVECRDGFARITLEELAITHFVKSGTLQGACSTRPRVVVALGKSAHSHIVRLMNSRQKEWWQKCTWTRICYRPTSRSIRETWQESDKKLGQKLSQRRSSDAQQVGCVFQDMTPSKSILRKCTDMRKPIQRVKFTKAIARYTKIRDQNPLLGYICPGAPHQRGPNAPEFEDRSQEETEWQEQGARRSSVEAGQKCVQIEGAPKSSILLTFGKWVPACINSLTWGTRICCRLRSINACDQQKGPEWCWNGYFDEVVQSNDSHHRQWRSADVWRDNDVCRRIGHFLLDFEIESPREHASSIVARKVLQWKRIFLRMDQWSKTTSHQERNSDYLWHRELRSNRGSWLDKFFLDIFITITDTHETGESFFFLIFFILTFFTYSRRHVGSRKGRCT